MNAIQFSMQLTCDHVPVHKMGYMPLQYFYHHLHCYHTLLSAEGVGLKGQGLEAKHSKLSFDLS